MLVLYHADFRKIQISVCIQPCFVAVDRFNTTDEKIVITVSFHKLDNLALHGHRAGGEQRSGHFSSFLPLEIQGGKFIFISTGFCAKIVVLFLKTFGRNIDYKLSGLFDELIGIMLRDNPNCHHRRIAGNIASKSHSQCIIPAVPASTGYKQARSGKYAQFQIDDFFCIV